MNETKGELETPAGARYMRDQIRAAIAAVLFLETYIHWPGCCELAGKIELVVNYIRTEGDAL